MSNTSGISVPAPKIDPSVPKDASQAAALSQQRNIEQNKLANPGATGGSRRRKHSCGCRNKRGGKSMRKNCRSKKGRGKMTSRVMIGCNVCSCKGCSKCSHKRSSRLKMKGGVPPPPPGKMEVTTPPATYQGAQASNEQAIAAAQNSVNQQQAAKGDNVEPLNKLPPGTTMTGAKGGAKGGAGSLRGRSGGKKRRGSNKKRRN